MKSAKSGGKEISMTKPYSPSKGGKGEAMPAAKGNKLSSEAGDVKKKDASQYAGIAGGSVHGKSKR